MVLMVDEEYYQKYKKDPSSVAIAQVVTSFDVLKFDLPGSEGNMSRPSNNELEQVFGTKNDMKIVEFMLEMGELHGTMKQGKHWAKEMKK